MVCRSPKKLRLCPVNPKEQTGTGDAHVNADHAAVGPPGELAGVSAVLGCR